MKIVGGPEIINGPEIVAGDEIVVSERTVGDLTFKVLKVRETPSNFQPFVMDPDLFGSRTSTDFSGERYPCDFYGGFSRSMKELVSAVNARFKKSIYSLELSERRLHIVFAPQPSTAELLELARIVGEYDRPYTRYEAILEEDDE